MALYSPTLKKKERKFLFDALNNKLNKKDKLKINELLWKSGAIDLTMELIINLINHVKNNLLTKYHETPTRMKWMFNLVDITQRILIPFKNQARKNKWVKYEYDAELLEDLTQNVLDIKTE